MRAASQDPTAYLSSVGPPRNCGRAISVSACVDITSSCPFRQQLMSNTQPPQGKRRKFIGLRKVGRKSGRGFGRELLTWDAFGHEMLTCSAQQKSTLCRACRGLARIVDSNQALMGSREGVSKRRAEMFGHKILMSTNGSASSSDWRVRRGCFASSSTGAGYFTSGGVGQRPAECTEVALLNPCGPSSSRRTARREAAVATLSTATAAGLKNTKLR
jgi:hypothetical protein